MISVDSMDKRLCLLEKHLNHSVYVESSEW